MDDDPAAHTYHKIMMTRAGIDEQAIVECYSADECIVHVSNAQGDSNVQDIIIADLSMPLKNGWALLEELKLHISKQYTPEVYLVTNSMDPNDKNKSESYPFVKGFKTKFLNSEFFSDLLSNGQN